MSRFTRSILRAIGDDYNINYPHENTLKVVERAKAVAQGDDYYYEYCQGNGP